MEQVVQCPVCTLYLHEGMSLGAHLDTHPKDQVIQALCSLAKSGKSPSHYGSRCSTPYESDRSYRSRSRTPFENRRHRHRHHAPRPPSRSQTPNDNYRPVLKAHDPFLEASTSTSKSDSFLHARSRGQPGRLVSTPLHSESNFPDKPEISGTVSDPTAPESVYLLTQNGSSEASLQRNFNRHGEFVFSKQPMPGESVALAAFAQPGTSYSTRGTPGRDQPEVQGANKRQENLTVLKANVPPNLQYLNSNGKPVHFVVPGTQSFIQSSHKNILISATMPQQGSSNGKSILGPVFQNQFSPIHSSTFQQRSSMLNQNSPIIYQEMNRELGGKPYLSALPILNGHEESASLPASVYQNLMAFNPYSSSPCLYPQQSTGSTEENMNPNYSEETVNSTGLQSDSNTFTNKIPTGSLSPKSNSSSNLKEESSNNPPTVETVSSKECEQLQTENQSSSEPKIVSDQGDNTNASDTTTKSGVKILSNIKIELPIQNSNLMPEIIDLTLAHDLQRKKMGPDIAEPNLNEDEAILPDFVDDEICNSYSQSRFCNRSNFSISEDILGSSPLREVSEDNALPIEIMTSMSSSQPAVVNTFSVIKNIGNPNLYKDNPSSSSQHHEEFRVTPDDCVLPDLTCNEKPSISPCSDLTNDSNEEAYDRLSIPDTVSTVPAVKPAPTPPKRFPLSAMVTRSVARKNLFVRKSRKILCIKNSKSTQKQINKPSSSTKPSPKSASPFREESIQEDEVPSERVDDEPEIIIPGISRLDVFFKEIDKNKKAFSDSACPSSTITKSPLTIESRSSSPTVKDDSRSFDADTKELSVDIEPECSLRTFKNDFHPQDPIVTDPKSTKEVEDCASVIEQLSDVSQKSFVELETLRPVVIAFGSNNTSNMPSNTTASFVDTPQKLIDSSNLLKEKPDLANLIQESYISDNSYTEYFTTEKEPFSGDSVAVNPENVVQKTEICIIDDDVPKDGEYIWNETPQKEEFAFSNFMQCNYSQGMYSRIEDCKKRQDAVCDTAQAQFSAGSMCSDNHDNHDYSDLICPRDSYLEQDHKGAFLEAMGSERACERTGEGLVELDSLNIRTDERMPPRGELSEQESSGDIDAPWAGMYCDVVGGSTSYDLLARETWASDGSDVDVPVSPTKHAFSEIEDIPIVVGVKPPDKNYKCATCGKSFNCPKERRVHRSKEHPTNTAAISSVAKKPPVKRKRQVPLKTAIKIKNEKLLGTEGLLSSLSSPKVGLIDPENPHIGDSGLINMNIKLVQGDISELETLEKKPKLELVKEETKRKRRDYSCITCKEEFYSDNSFHEHLKIHPLECLTCGKFFNRRANLKLHIKRHLGIKNFRCDICEKRFITKQKMIEHYNVHTNSAPIKCSHCEETFRRHSNMVQHRNRHHFHMKRRLRDYVCHCGEVFHSKKKLAWHKEIHDDRPKACLHCSEKFIHMASLTRHMRRAHNNYYVPDEKRKRENVQCPICSQVYLKSSIDMHLRTHTGKKPYSCVICNKNFTTKWNLKLHRWTHANRSSKPFKCALCKGAFIRHADYVSHMNAHKSVRPYTCNYCGCQFIRKYNCQRHVKEHENDKKYVCQVLDCGKTFHRSYYLSEHMRVHSGARPFSCNICGKTSSTKSNHNKHVKIHHAREPVTTEG